MKVNLVNSHNKKVKQVKLGFSWTVLFFGALPMLFRADWKWFFITFAMNVILGTLFFPVAFVGNLLLAINYNSLYIKDLMKKGYIAGDDTSKTALLAKGICSANFVVMNTENA